ncbi:MAG: DUF2953 domain-containing protein [Lawsonibacter sp.]|nr:DUF2953 domain-containing protein [Lawsonibacter sp.]
MKALFVLAVVVLVLLLLGQVRVGGRAEFNAEGFFLWIRLGRFHIRLLPAKPKKEKEPQEPKKPRKKKPKKPKKERPPTPLPEKIGGALEYAQALLPVGLEAAKGMWRGLRVDVLELELTAGGSDPADTAMLYGQANAALGALWHPLTKAFHVKDGTARVKLDFDASGTTVYGQAALSIKIGTVVWIGLRAGWKALFRALAARKRLKRKRRKAA